MQKKVIQEAEKWIGYLEKASDKNLENFQQNSGYNNYTIFAQQYLEYFDVNLQGQPWCAMFVSCVFRNALGKETQTQILPHFAYCPTGVNQFKKMKGWYIENPQVGDVIFFKDTQNVACHVGIIYKVDNTKVYTIEGNTTSKTGVVANGGAVCKKQYAQNYNKILGYGRPQYKTIVPWQEEFLNKLINKGYITNREEWSKYEEPVSKSYCVALIDKITGGLWTSSETDSTIHWIQPHIISLCGKQIIQDKNSWLIEPDANISKALILALIDKATGGLKQAYQNINYDHWARAHLNSLCDKEIINTPIVWSDDFEGEVLKGNFMALICKAYNI